MRRRRFLAGLVAAGTLAGCLDDGGPNGAEADTPTDAATATPTPIDAGGTDGGTAAPSEDTLTVESMTLQHGLVIPETPDSIMVGHESNRYLWVSVTTPEDPPALSDLSLEVHPNSYDPLAADDVRDYRTGWGDEQYYDGTRGSSLVLFELPKTADTPRIEFESPAGHVRATEAETERLGREPPAMSVTLEKRYEDSPDEPVAAVVTNEGDVDGRFLGAVNRQGPRIAYTPVARIAAPVAAGEQRTIPVSDPQTHRTESPDGEEPDMTYRVQSLHGDDGAVFGDG